MSELMREIEEDIRRERFDKLWKDFGRVMIGASIAVIVATAILVVWQNHRQGVAQTHTAQLMHGVELFEQQDYKGAIAAFDALSANANYYGIAMLRKAQAQAASGDKEGAAKSYAALAKQDDTFGELAKIQAQDKDFQPKLSSPFYFTQSEFKGWQLLQQGKQAEAVTQFTALRDNDHAPYTLRERMRGVLRQIAPEKAETAKGSSHE